ncbi:hypothetical protein AVEN_87391-1, partial [Araneus ventricosus]
MDRDRPFFMVDAMRLEQPHHHAEMKSFGLKSLNTGLGQVASCAVCWVGHLCGGRSLIPRDIDQDG